MKAILYVAILLLSMGAVSKEIKDPSHSDLLITYQKLKAKAIDGDVDSQYEIWHFAKNHRPKLDNRLR